jgi:hypothetical protein
MPAKQVVCGILGVVLFRNRSNHDLVKRIPSNDPAPRLGRPAQPIVPLSA